MKAEFRRILFTAALTIYLVSPAQATLLGPSGGAGLSGEYASFSDSPFNGLSFSYFYLENFEDGGLNTPGVTASVGQVYGPSSITDSVDSDDGIIDGSGAGGHNWLIDPFVRRNDPIIFSFDAAVLGGLPTHAGIVYTDGVGLCTFEAFGPGGTSLGTIGPINLDDDAYVALTRDDRFFGAINADGISAIKIQSMGLEVDHLQYGKIVNQYPDMSQWVGKWFSVKTTYKGTAFDTSVSKFYKDNGGGPAYMRIWNWDPLKQEFQFDTCNFDKDDGKWSVTNRKFLFLAGTNIKFLWLYDDRGGDNEGTVFTALMEGRGKNGILQGANIKTLGGTEVSIGDEDISAGSFSLSGKMIDSSKVPVDCSVTH